MKHELLQKDRDKYISWVLLNEMINFQTSFPVKIADENIYIEHYLKIMMGKGLVAVDKNSYVPTELGRNEIVNLYAKYYEYLKIYDIFCAVDLEEGNFAFEMINTIVDDDKWNDYLSNDRFSDVRVAVAEFKGINPLEIVFLSFLNENRFDCGVDRWQHRLTGDDVWNEIQEICNTAITMEYLLPDNVLENVIVKGSQLALQLIKESEEAIQQDEEENIQEEIIEETITEEYVEIVEMPTYGYDYFDSYYDPYYVSPIWLGAAIILW